VFIKPKRNVYTVFIHCSASDNPDHDSIDVINEWHQARGWSTVGYHYFIRKDGTIEEGRSLERTPAAQKGHNTGSIAICIHGLELALFTEEELASLRHLCEEINESYKDITFHAHNEVNSNKTCPVIAVKEVLGLTDDGQMV
jgi:N-acetyl-anhydromuramyl-L-alanine amidase AmpD